MQRLEPLLAPFPTATPSLLEAHALLRRIDTKFVVDTETVARLMPSFARDYAAVRVPTGAVATYRSLYWDTPDLRCYLDHTRGRRLRHKVRIRHYADRAVSFLELKSKRNEMVTVKRRLDLGYGDELLGTRERGFLGDHVGELAAALAPQLRIDFRRVSLVALEHRERVTIDLGIVVTRSDGTRDDLGELAVIEVKQPTYSGRTPAMRLLLDARLRPRSVSKYVAAIERRLPGRRR